MKAALPCPAAVQGLHLAWDLGEGAHREAHTRKLVLLPPSSFYACHKVGIASFPLLPLCVSPLVNSHLIYSLLLIILLIRLFSLGQALLPSPCLCFVACIHQQTLASVTASQNLEYNIRKPELSMGLVIRVGACSLGTLTC